MERAKRLALRSLPVLAACAGLGSLLLFVSPASVASALAHADTGMLVPVALLMLAFYALQGFRWHLLLRTIGVENRVSETQLTNMAGQALTAVLPLGDLGRALMVSRSSRVSFGAAAATVTVQELCFTSLVVLLAAPGVARLPGGYVWMTALLAAVAATVAVLTVQRLFTPLHRGIARTPVLRRFTSDIEALQGEVRRLLARPGVLAGAVFDLGRAILAAATLLVVLHAFHVETLGWWDAALVFAASCVGGALSMLPGGIGANEASVVGVLVLLGVNPAAAAGAAIVQRLSLTLIPTVAGSLAYLVLRHRRSAALATVEPMVRFDTRAPQAA
jgi:uncharacterized protein (TIRG00374 family)